MAVIIQAFDVVVRVEAYPGGAGAFARAVPNATFCTDGRLARASFMDSGDREAFVTSLALGSAVLARIDTHTGPPPEVDWLEHGRHAGVHAAWLRGAPRDPLVVPLSWSPGTVFFAPREPSDHLEYLGTENGVEAYRDKRTGQKLYAGRTRPSMAPEEAAKLAALQKEAHALVAPYVAPRASLGFFDKRKLTKGIAKLEQVIAGAPDAWSSLWLLGMSLRALGEHGKALAAFRRAYAINPAHADVGREYGGQCFILGEAAEGVRISRELHARFPDDVGLQSNLALALLIGGDLDEALDVARAAHAREPSDPITKNLLDYIGQVKAGGTPRPTKLPGH